MTAPNSITVTVLQLANAALSELGVLAAGESAAFDDQAWTLQKLQRLIDTYNARRVMVYANVFQSFALSPNVTPTTIGPGGIFNIAQRPVEIPTIGLQLINTSPTTVEIFLNRRDKDWWANQRVKNLTSVIPTDYYYEPDWPLGSIYFWPVANANNNVLLQMRTVIVEPTAYNASFTMPPGYWNMVCYDLAVELAPSYEREPSPTLLRNQQRAQNAVLSNNIKSPMGSTGDAGMPGTGITGGGFNYYSGTVN